MHINLAALAAIRCRFGCAQEPIGIFQTSRDGLNYSDPVQVLCQHHFNVLLAEGPVTVLIDLRRKERNGMPVAQVNGKYLGKKPARDGAVRFKFKDYVHLRQIKVPAVFGHVINTDYGMLGNDTVGNCVIADIAHQIMIRARATHRPVPEFTAQNIIAVYGDWTGYDPRAALDANGNNPTDQGTDMAVAASNVRTQGFPDVHGQFYFTKAYGAIHVRNWDELMAATYLFGTVSVGINLQKAQGDQFDNRQPWQYVQGSPFLGGHCITLCGRNSRGLAVAISWGRTTGIERHLLEQTMDEGIIQFSLDYILPSGVSPEAINVAQLDSDLAALT